MHMIAQTMAYTLTDLQKNELPFLNQIADVKNISLGEKAAFNAPQGKVEAYIQAKGATTARSMIGGRQIVVDTVEVSARPAVNIVELSSGRKNMAELIREANVEISNKKMEYVQRVLNAGIETYSTPYFGSGAGVIQATIDPQIMHFRRMGRVALLGDIAPLSKLADLTGMSMNSNDMQFAPGAIDQFHRDGFIGNYKGSAVIAMPNAYAADGITPVLDPKYIYILPVAATGDARNLKVVNEGPVRSIQSQNIDDKVFEVCLDQWFGAALCVGDYPTIGAYKDTTL